MNPEDQKYCDALYRDTRELMDFARDKFREAGMLEAEIDALVPPMRKPVPSPLYPCLHCADDASWPAADLFWSEAEQGWVCDNCWDERDIDEDAGISLERELAR